jgi:hypothetical protein
MSAPGSPVQKTQKTEKPANLQPQQYVPLLTVLEGLPNLVTYFDIYEKINHIYANGHVYNDEWKTVVVSDVLAANLVRIVRHQEEVAQLKGLGLWLLMMLLQSSDNSPLLSALLHPESLIDVLKMLTHQENHGHAFSLLMALISLGKLTFSQLYSPRKFRLSGPEYICTYSLFRVYFWQLAKCAVDCCILCRLQMQ